MKFRNLIIILGIVAVLGSCSEKDTYKPITHSDWLKNHLYTVGQQTLLFHDSTRNRPLKTELWYPTPDTNQTNISAGYPFQLPPTSKGAEAQQNILMPLILLSHGTGGNRISLMWLACELAGQGYAVAAIDHFGNTMDNKIPENFVRIWDRPRDISFTIDKLLDHTYWSTKIDTTKIGIVGFSLGGYTAIALAGGQIDYNALKEFSQTKEGIAEFTLPELGNISGLLTSNILNEGAQQNKVLKDKRIKAFVALAPALGQGYQSSHQFEYIEHPVLIIGAQADERTPVGTNAKHYHWLIKNSRYIELKGKVGHYAFMNIARAELRRDAPAIFNDDVSVKREEIHKIVADTVLHFFERSFQ